MKIKIELEVEFADYPEDVRKVMAKEAQCSTVEMERLKDYSAQDLAELFNLGPNPFIASELTAGSMIYANLVNMKVIKSEQVG